MVTVSTMARSSSSRDISFETDAGAARIRWDGPRATLFLDGIESSAVDTSDPTYLEFEYMQHMSAVVRAVWGAQDRFRALHVLWRARGRPRTRPPDTWPWRWIGFWPSRCASISRSRRPRR